MWLAFQKRLHRCSRLSRRALQCLLPSTQALNWLGCPINIIWDSFEH